MRRQKHDESLVLRDEVTFIWRYFCYGKLKEVGTGEEVKTMWREERKQVIR